RVRSGRESDARGEVYVSRGISADPDPVDAVAVAAQPVLHCCRIDVHTDTDVLADAELAPLIDVCGYLLGPYAEPGRLVVGQEGGRGEHGEDSENGQNHGQFCDAVPRASSFQK